MLGKQIVDIRQAQRKRKVSSHSMPDDLGGKAVALEMLVNGLVESIRSTSHYHLDQHQS